MRNHVIRLLALTLFLSSLTACVPGEKAEQELLPSVHVYPWSSEITLQFEDWRIPAENEACGDKAVQKAADAVNGSKQVLTVMDISRMAYEMAPTFSMLKDSAPADWVPISASLYDYSVWVVLYVDGAVYGEAIKEAMAPNHRTDLLDYELMVFLSAFDGHIVDVTDQSGTSLSSQNITLSRDATAVSLPYPAPLTMEQSRFSLTAALETYDSISPGYSSGIVKDTVFADETMQERCRSFAAEQPLSTPESVCKYVAELEAVLKENGYLGEKWTATSQIIYKDGCCETVFLPKSNRPQMMKDSYRVYFSLKDGHVIDIRYLVNKWGDYERIAPKE